MYPCFQAVKGPFSLLLDPTFFVFAFVYSAVGWSVEPRFGHGLVPVVRHYLMVRMTSRLLCLLVILIVCIPLFLIINHSDQGSSITKYLQGNGHTEDDGDEKSYGVIMDAGSTGTRLFLYTWTSNSDKELINISPALDHLNSPVVKKVSPGLSSFQDHPHEAAEYVKPLLDYASQFIPLDKLPYTPVFLLATAGMRLVPEKQQKAILYDLHTKLPQMTPMQIMKEHIRIIEGRWEGIYSWIAINYILGNFKGGFNSSLTRPETVGMIDMGGASMQIAFEMDQRDEFRSENVENINLGCRDDDDRHKYKLFVTTFLGYGVNEGLRKYEQELSDRLMHTKESYVRDECMPVNLQKIINRSDGSMFVRKGIGDWDGCVKQISEMLNKPSVNPKHMCEPKCFFGNVAAPTVSLSKMKLYGFSEYWYSLDDVLSLGGKYNFSLIAEKSKQFCSQRWSHIQAAKRAKLYPKADEDRLKSQCFKSAWITSVLHDGFEVDRQKNNFQSAFTLAGQEVQWALGAMIYHMRYFPLKNSASNLVINSTYSNVYGSLKAASGQKNFERRVFVGPYVLMCAVVALVNSLSSVSLSRSSKSKLYKMLHEWKQLSFVFQLCI
ncbi:unnamed protein product [Cylicocyclus nassatus]|uniref:Uncharacterized protein n=1 Tax=Cylicocyclus nassatus TaxID=53992 RepID=A0AA36DUK5_CYLNA|nr:unnamed protein product [Cylicocyclus nassatus]